MSIFLSLFSKFHGRQKYCLLYHCDSLSTSNSIWHIVDILYIFVELVKCCDMGGTIAVGKTGGTGGLFRAILQEITCKLVF